MKQEKIPPRPAAGRAAKPRTRRPAASETYVPVHLRERHDGWTPDRQLDFIEALAASGCVTEAAKAVGLSKAAAYKLRARPDAQAFRLAWDAAIDFAMAQLVDAALGRAINGVAVPIFHQGEQVGERREYPEQLAMFLLAAHAPTRFGRPRQEAPQPLTHFDYRGLMLGKMIALLDEQARTARPGDYPTVDQMRLAASMLGVDLDLFLPPAMRGTGGDAAGGGPGEARDAAADPDDWSHYADRPSP